MTEDEELRLERTVNRGMQADAVVNNPVFMESMLHIRAELMRAFEQTKFSQNVERDEIWRKLQTMAWFEAHIVRVMKNGEVAQKTLAQRLKESTHRLFNRA
jgi:hypothetical protein